MYFCSYIIRLMIFITDKTSMIHFILRYNFAVVTKYLLCVKVHYVYLYNHFMKSTIKSSATVSGAVRMHIRVLFIVVAIFSQLSTASAGGLLGDAIEGLCGNCGIGSKLDDLHEDIGKPLDTPGRLTREALVETLGPALAEAIRHSRNNARSAGVRPIPAHIKAQIAGFYPDSLLNGVAYRVGQGHELTVQANSIRFGDAAAVALIDTIVFASPWDAQNNVVLWVHELKHIDQYRRWGLTDFGKRYVRSHRRVEAEAERAERDFESWRRTRSTSGNLPNNRPGGSTPVHRPIAYMCTTNLGACPMGIAAPVGSQCYCPSWRGPIWGVAR